MSGDHTGPTLTTLRPARPVASVSAITEETCVLIEAAGDFRAAWRGCIA